MQPIFKNETLQRLTLMCKFRLVFGSEINRMLVKGSYGNANSVFNSGPHNPSVIYLPLSVFYF